AVSLDFGGVALCGVLVVVLENLDHLAVYLNRIARAGQKRLLNLSDRVDRQPCRSECIYQTRLILYWPTMTRWRCRGRSDVAGSAQEGNRRNRHNRQHY